MGTGVTALFNAHVWEPALEKYGAVTHLSVAIYDADQQLVCGPVPPSPLHALFVECSSDLGLFADCARQCLAQQDSRPAILVSQAHGLAVVGTSLVTDGVMVGAAVAGYALVDFPQALTLERLAKAAAVPHVRLREIARLLQPVPERRLMLHGELLQVLADTILRENARTRQYEKATAELEEALAAKDEFLAVLSHELRTPLTPIVAWTRMLRMLPEPAKILQAADVIERNALLQIRLVDDLLELNRATRGTMSLDLKVLCLNTMVASALEVIAETAGRKQIAIEFIDAGEPLFVEGDADRMQQILRNVLTNAVKFTQSGGQVLVVLVRQGNESVIHVTDNGPGIAKEFLPFLFDMFRQQEVGTRRSHSGLGIGLSLVKRLTEAHGGQVTITSEGAGHGTDVMLQFPLALEAGEPETPAAPSDRALDDMRVLLVEDTRDSRDAASAMLQRMGATVTVAGDGQEALEALGQPGGIDLVLCDLRMPRMDGYEFLRALNLDPDRPHPPVIAVTGLTGSADHQRTHAAGFEGHVDKPFNEAALLAEINVVMARHRPSP